MERTPPTDKKELVGCQVLEDSANEVPQARNIATKGQLVPQSALMAMEAPQQFQNLCWHQVVQLQMSVQIWRWVPQGDLEVRLQVLHDVLEQLLVTDHQMVSASRVLLKT